MKHELVLVTGGARSGKSSYGESLLADCASKFYIATAPKLDEEMICRVRLHQARRAAGNWTSIEEELDLADAVRRAEMRGADGILVDCLTLWINNILYREPDFQEKDMPDRFAPVLALAKAFPGRFVMVLNEVGMGVVPENALARTFRDVSGRCGQLAAQAADTVVLMTCGIPLTLKGNQ